MFCSFFLPWIKHSKYPPWRHGNMTDNHPSVSSNSIGVSMNELAIFNDMRQYSEHVPITLAANHIQIHDIYIYILRKLREMFLFPLREARVSRSEGDGNIFNISSTLAILQAGTWRSVLLSPSQTDEGHRRPVASV